MAKHVDIFLPNAREAMQVTGSTDLETAVEILAEIVPLLVVKLGARGALARRGSEQYFSQALEVDVADPVGAGDSLYAGNRAGALSATRPGGTEAFRDREYRETFYREHSHVRNV